MPSLNTGRGNHGCTNYYTGEEQVLLVTGGFGFGFLDSTEVLRPGSEWQEITSARLPRPLAGVRVITVNNNRVLLFGGRGSDDTSEEILEYKDGRWNKRGTMKNSRSGHGVSLVNFNEIEGFTKGNKAAVPMAMEPYIWV